MTGSDGISQSLKNDIEALTGAADTVKNENGLDFAEIGYEAATMTAIAEPKISALNYWSALKAGHSSRTAGKLNAELSSIVWIVLSP